MANLAKGQLREKLGELEEALRGLMGPHQQLLLSTQLRHLDFLDQEIGRLDSEVAQRLSPFEEALQAVDTIPGVGRRTAETQEDTRFEEIVRGLHDQGSIFLRK